MNPDYISKEEIEQNIKAISNNDFKNITLPRRFLLNHMGKEEYYKMLKRSYSKIETARKYNRKYQQEYYKSPHIKKKLKKYQKKYYSREDVKKRQREYFNSPEQIAKRRLYQRKRYQIPSVKAKRKEYQRQYYLKKKHIQELV